jgi:hypothetical protein
VIWNSTSFQDEWPSPWKFNLEYGGTFTKLFMHVSCRNMFPTTRNLQIHVHVYRPRHCCGEWLTLHETYRFNNNHCQECVCLPQHPWLFIFSSRGHDRQSLDQNFSSQGYDRQTSEQNNQNLIHVVWTNFFFAIILMWYTRNIYIYFFINWTLRMSNNLPQRVQILCHVHIICITLLENRIICCQIFCDLLFVYKKRS